MEGTVEEKATELGWTDQEAWTEKGGDPEKWRDADEFMKYGEQNVRFVRQSLQKDRENEREEDKAEFASRLANLERVSKDAIEKQRKTAEVEKQQLLDQLKIERKQKASEDDTAGVVAVTEQIEELSKETPPQTEHPANAEFNRKYVPLIMANDEVRQFTDVAAAMINRDNPTMDPVDFFKELEQQVKDEFSEREEFARYFGKTPKKVPKVESPEGGPTTGEGQKWSNIPKEDQAVGKEFIADGLFKNQQEYADAYFKQE